MASQPLDPAEQPIVSTLWWVIPGRLAGVRKPTAAELDELRRAGIGALVSVMDDPGNLELYAEARLPHLWLPVPGGRAPGPEQIEEFSTFVAEHNASGTAVAVHCTSGRRRTGTFLAAYLIARGTPFAVALQTIQAANPAVELREAQIAFLQTLARANHPENRS